MSRPENPALINRRLFATTFAALLACASTKTVFAQTGIAEDAVVQMVERAASAIAEHGLQEATRHTPPDTWVRNDLGLYVFVIDSKGTLHLHPQERMIGRNIRRTRDVSGERFIEKILYLAGKSGDTAWTEYFWPDPVDGRTRKKRVYSKKIGKLIVNCGYYLDQA